MKRALFFSITLHMLMFSIAFFFIQEKKDALTQPFFAKLIAPDDYEMHNKHAQSLIQPAQKPPLTQSKPVKPKLTPPLTDTNMQEYKNMPAEKDSSFSGNSQEVNIPNLSSLTNRDPSISEKSKDESFKKPETGITAARPSKGAGERLFDTDIIARLPQREREATKSDKGITFDTREFKYYGYLQKLKEKIEGIWRYPLDAAEKGIYGDLYVRFTIKKNGKLGAIELIRTSGHKILDDAAIRALKDAEPYWPLPEEWGTDGFTITGHFVYSIYGTYIR